MSAKCGVEYEVDLSQIRYDECGLHEAQWYAYVNTKINFYTYLVNQQMHTGKIYYIIYIILLIVYMFESHLLVYCVNVIIPLKERI